jgi:hypothetical protein
MPTQTKYKIDIQQYANNQLVISNCNAITFINNGATDVLINNIPLAVGANLSIQGNADELDTTQYNIAVGTSTTANVIVIKKMNQWQQ